MHDRFSRPHHHPAPRPGRRGATGRTPAARAPHRTCAAGGPCRCRILHRLPHPAPPRPACACRAGPGHRQPRRRRRYERARPGEPVHIDVKKPGRIPDGGGHKVLGRQAGRANRKPSMAGYVCLPSPPAPRPGSPTRASALTGPGPGGRRPTARRTFPPHLLEERAHQRPYTSKTERQAAVPDRLDRYNHHRPRTGIDSQTPAGHVTNLSGQHTQGRLPPAGDAGLTNSNNTAMSRCHPLFLLAGPLPGRAHRPTRVPARRGLVAASPCSRKLAIRHVRHLRTGSRTDGPAPPAREGLGQEPLASSSLRWGASAASVVVSP